MRKLFYLPLLILFISGCRSLAPNRMFVTPDGFSYATDSTQKNISTTYLIQPYDRLEMHIFSNDGFKLVDITSNGANPNGIVTEGTGISYKVDEDGEVKLPIIGKTHIRGFTVDSAEALLEKKYARYFNEPFVLLKVINRHVLVFQGDGGKGTVVTLQNDNTTLFEALAAAGGIPDWGRSYQIKIIRGDLKNPEIHLVNIFSVEGLRNSELRVLSNDIIYVDAGPNYKQRLLLQITPVVGILTSLLLILNLVIK